MNLIIKDFINKITKFLMFSKYKYKQYILVIKYLIENWKSYLMYYCFSIIDIIAVYKVLPNKFIFIQNKIFNIQL